MSKIGTRCCSVTIQAPRRRSMSAIYQAGKPKTFLTRTQQAAMSQIYMERKAPTTSATTAAKERERELAPLWNATGYTPPLEPFPSSSFSRNLRNFSAALSKASCVPFKSAFCFSYSSCAFFHCKLGLELCFRHLPQLGFHGRLLQCQLSGIGISILGVLLPQKSLQLLLNLAELLLALLEVGHLTFHVVGCTVLLTFKFGGITVGAISVLAGSISILLCVFGCLLCCQLLSADCINVTTHCLNPAFQVINAGLGLGNFRSDDIVVMLS